MNLSSLRNHRTVSYHPSQLGRPDTPSQIRFAAGSAEQTIANVEETVEFFKARDNEVGVDKNAAKDTVVLESESHQTGKNPISGKLEGEHLQAEFPTSYGLGRECFAKITDQNGNTYHVTGDFDLNRGSGGGEHSGLINVVKTTSQGEVTVIHARGADGVDAGGGNFFQVLMA